jgi:RNA polymerase sigma-70 factor (ECF subfamily)
LSSGHGDYETLVRPIEDRMIRSVWRILRCPQDADDAFQEALTTVWKRLNRIRRHPNPHALILRICVNSAYDVVRRKARHQAREKLEAVPETLPDPSPSAAERISGGEKRAEIFQAISRLPRKQAEAVLMRFVEELPYSEIAQALGCREVTVRKHIARARTRLSRDLAHLAPYSRKEVLKNEAEPRSEGVG